MDVGHGSTHASPKPPIISRDLVLTQFILGLLMQFLMALPFLRRTHGMHHLRRGQTHLIVINHVSLLDTLLLSSLCWRSGCYPILVLGDKGVWQASWIRQFLSKRTGFLLERGKLNPNRIAELEEFGRSGKYFQLIVFPEGTRGDGVNVAVCQPGIYHIAKASHLPIIPVFIENMQLVSTKTGGFHPFRGWRKVEVHFGAPIPAEHYLHLPREDFTEFVRHKIAAARQTPPASC